MNTLPTTITLATVDFAELTDDATGLREVSKQLAITSDAMYELAGEELITVKTRIKKVEELRMTITDPLTKAHKATMSLFKVPLELLEEAKQFYQRGMLAYTSEQDIKRKEEQLRLDAIANAERTRLEAEAKAAEEAAAKLKGKAAAEARFAAQQLAESARNVTAVVVEEVKPVSAGNSVRKVWVGECTDFPALVRFVVDHPDYINLLVIDQTALNNLAKSQQDSFAINGCRAYQNSSITSRTK